MFSFCSSVRFFDSFISYSDEIGIDSISGTFLYFRNYLVITIVFTLTNLIIYLIISGSFVFTSTIYTISLCISFVYVRESPIWKGEIVALF